ncbi:hypothetical protein DAPPUDRAFT_98001 [Daphnia pulex]|uniref:Uncharacterized protein n=1 Tax=Daphnia pulex TaxID=6669 RepID=E9G211_DAPPU|nr:hypothetical protein DAPPUDRAFT_98001 [Daphnia pulex]|eukprot:EFX86387.1 hypothetical protein DAPPUDRAFT_98001 [Daphnia pulex]
MRNNRCNAASDKMIEDCLGAPAASNEIAHFTRGQPSWQAISFGATVPARPAARISLLLLLLLRSGYLRKPPKKRKEGSKRRSSRVVAAGKRGRSVAIAIAISARSFTRLVDAAGLCGRQSWMKLDRRSERTPKGI